MSASLSSLKRILIGEPFPTHREIHERLDKVRALAIFASDPISSNAYATEAIMSVLLIMGTGALNLTLPLALGVMGLVLLVVFSYIQTILHYPDGGGAYTVTKDNLGRNPALFAGAALLIDYVLTVSVSVSAGIRAVTSAVPWLLPYSVLLALLAIFILTMINLRGVRESGTIFAIPTYLFILGVIITVVLGLARFAGLFGLTPPVPPTLPPHVELETVGNVSNWLFLWLVLRAFAAGCTALTGIEAISNGVQAFKPPEAQNAAKTMVAMGLIAMILFGGITYVATHIGLVPYEEESILSQMARSVTEGLPGGGFLYYWVQLFTMLILILAANTGYQDFPRLSSFLAHDGFMPRWMTNRGDRLVYNYGIITLAAVSSIVVVIFRADEIAMLPLYALGVMLCFTLSQASMFKLMGRIAHLKPGEKMKTHVTEIHYEKGTWWKRPLNGFGAIVTGIVLIILILTKFTEGAWAVVIIIPILVWGFHRTNEHYAAVAKTLSLQDFNMAELHTIADVVIVPIAGVHKGTLQALRYAKRFSQDVRAVYINTNEEVHQRILRRWHEIGEITEGIHLVVIPTDFRDILTPLVEYIDQVNDVEFANQTITVVVPEFVPDAVPARILHNQTALLLRERLRHHGDVVIIDVPFQVHG